MNPEVGRFAEAVKAPNVQDKVIEQLSVQRFLPNLVVCYELLCAFTHMNSFSSQNLETCTNTIWRNLSWKLQNVRDPVHFFVGNEVLYLGVFILRTIRNYKHDSTNLLCVT